ncbi:MAG: division/cell wall cluster transcriptional repressor MraZ [Acidimicrobiales bacterium]
MEGRGVVGPDFGARTGIEYLHGAGEYKVDSKSRLIIPADFRRPPFVTGKKVAVVARHNFGCLAIWPRDLFQEQLRAAYAAQDDGPEELARAQALTWNSDPADIDPQWRVTLRSDYREWAGLELDSAVSVVGSFDHIELWEPNRWASRNDRYLAKLMEGSLAPSHRQREEAGAAEMGAA